MLAGVDTLIHAIENVSPEHDTQYFIRRTRHVSNAWRRFSGNVPVVTPDYHTPVSGWTTDVDAETGHPFFTHGETGETTWVLPEGEEAPPSYDDLDVVEEVYPLPSQVEHERRMQKKREGSAAPADAADWDAVTDEDTGQVYYYNASTGASSWSWPPVVEDEEPAVVEVVDEDSDYLAMIMTTGGGSRHQRSQSQQLKKTDLQVEDWVLHTDPDTGNQYWWNEATQETKWA